MIADSGFISLTRYKGAILRIPGSELFKTKSFKEYSQKIGLPPGTLVYIGEERTDPVRITVIDYDETYFYEDEVETIQECLHFKSAETVTWIQIAGIHNPMIIEEIGEHFGVNALVLEDLMK